MESDEWETIHNDTKDFIKTARDAQDHFRDATEKDQLDEDAEQPLNMLTILSSQVFSKGKRLEQNLIDQYKANKDVPLISSTAQDVAKLVGRFDEINQRGKQLKVLAHDENTDWTDATELTENIEADFQASQGLLDAVGDSVETFKQWAEGDTVTA